MDLCGAVVLTIWALLWFFLSLIASGFAFVAVCILIAFDMAAKFGRKLWRLT